MPNKRAADKAVIGFYIPRTIRARAEKLAKRQGITLSELMAELLIQATLNEVLTADDYDKIAKETREYERRELQKKRKS